MFSQENKVRVTTESASIYVKPEIKSQVIETVKKETILNLFQTQKLSQIWYYVSYYSEKRKAHISGFVKVTAAARIENSQNKSNNLKKRLKKEEKKPKINPLLKKEIIAAKKFNKEEPKIKRPFKKKETKPLSAKIGNIQNTSKTNTVKVTAGSTSIYAKPNIKSYAIETVKKETILNLFQSQKLSRIWYYVSYYSEKRRAFVSGFVKVTAVEIIDHIQKKPSKIEKELKKREKPAIPPGIIKQFGNSRQIKNKKKEIRQKEKLSITPLALKTAASFQKLTMRQEKLEEKIIKTAFPTKEVVAFQKITEPPVEIKTEEMPSLNPPPTFVITAFKKTKEEPEKIKGGQKFSSLLLPKKEAPYSKKLIETQKEPKAKKPLNATSPIREIKTSQNRKEGKRPKEKLPIETKIRPVPAKSKAVPKTSYAKKVKVTTESTNIYAKSDIKSQVIETVKKETILNLSRTQKKPKIWNNITLYSEKRKAYISGFVKVTAVAKIDHIQKESKEIKEKLKKEEKETFVSPSPAKEIISIKKLEKEAPKIKKLPVELEVKLMHLKTSDIQKKISQVRVSLPDSLAETAYEVKKSLKAEQNELKKEEKSTTQTPQIDEIVTVQKPKNWKEEIKGEEKLSVTFYPKKRAVISQRLNEEKKESKKEEKILNSAFATKEVEASSNLKKEQNQIKKPHEEAEIKPMPTLPKKRISKGKFRLITLGIGYGQSYGGAGGFIQLNTKARLSLHGGIGYFPAYLFYSESDWVRGTMLYSGGLKYYLPLGSDPLNFYLDLQFCGIGVEAAHVFSGSFYYGPLFNNVQKTLWGPSFLAGIEVKMGRLGLNGAFGVSYNITKANWLEQNLFLTFDLGLLLYF